MPCRFSCFREKWMEHLIPSDYYLAHKHLRDLGIIEQQMEAYFFCAIAVKLWAFYVNGE